MKAPARSYQVGGLGRLIPTILTINNNIIYDDFEDVCDLDDMKPL